MCVINPQNRGLYRLRLQKKTFGRLLLPSHLPPKKREEDKEYEGGFWTHSDDVAKIRISLFNCMPAADVIAKKVNYLSFYRSFNAIFGKVCRAASEEVVLHLVKTKCLPILLYAL